MVSARRSPSWPPTFFDEVWRGLTRGRGVGGDDALHLGEQAAGEVAHGGDGEALGAKDLSGEIADPLRGDGLDAGDLVLEGGGRKEELGAAPPAGHRVGIVERGLEVPAVAALGLGERVSFVGGLGREGVLRMFRAADAVLLSSRWENFPHVIVEAFAVGTPVISSAVGGVPEVVRDGENGLLVPAGDVEALAAAIRRLLGDDDLRARLAAAAAPSVESYSTERLLGQIEAELQAAR